MWLLIFNSIGMDTEDEMFDEAFNLIECEYYMAWCKNVQAEMNDKITQLIKHLNEKYGQNILKAAGTIKKLMKADTLMIELLFHMDHDRFVPNKFAMNINGNTVENIYSKENISVLEAFEKMASLKK